MQSISVLEQNKSNLLLEALKQANFNTDTCYIYINRKYKNKVYVYIADENLDTIKRLDEDLAKRIAEAFKDDNFITIFKHENKYYSVKIRFTKFFIEDVMLEAVNLLYLLQENNELSSDMKTLN